MGAFGNLLQSYFGGTVHDVKTWSTVQSKEKTITVSEIEADENYNEVINGIISKDINILYVREDDFNDDLIRYDNFLEFKEKYLPFLEMFSNFKKQLW